MYTAGRRYCIIYRKYECAFLQASPSGAAGSIPLYFLLYPAGFILQAPAPPQPKFLEGSRLNLLRFAFAGNDPVMHRISGQLLGQRFLCSSQLPGRFRKICSLDLNQVSRFLILIDQQKIAFSSPAAIPLHPQLLIPLHPQPPPDTCAARIIPASAALLRLFGL